MTNTEIDKLMSNAESGTPIWLTKEEYKWYTEFKQTQEAITKAKG